MQKEIHMNKANRKTVVSGGADGVSKHEAESVKDNLRPVRHFIRKRVGVIAGIAHL